MRFRLLRNPPIAWRNGVVGLVRVAGLSAALLGVLASHAQASEALTLPQALEQALAANPAIHSHELDVQTQALEKEIATGRRLPRLDLTSSVTRYAYPTTVTPIREAGVFPPLDRDIASVGLALAVPLYSGGRLTAGISLAEHNLEAAAQTLRGAGQDLMFNVASTYTKALHLRDLQRAVAARVQTLETEQALLLRRLDEGRAARLELVRLQTQLSQARHDFLAARQGEQDALTLLATLLGSPSTLPNLADIAPTVVKLPDSRDEALARAARQRPELQRAQALERAAVSNVQIAASERLPQVSLVASAQETAGAGEWKGYGGGQIGVLVSVPIFDGSISKNRVAQARLEVGKSQLRIRQTADAIVSEVEQAVGAFGESRGRLQVAAQGEREADEALRIEMVRFSAGESTVTDLLASEAALWAARVNRLQAGYDVVVSQARLLRSIGELSPESFQPVRATKMEQGSWQ